MILWSEDFETGPDGATVTTANTAWETVSVATNPLEFDSSRVKSGTLSATRVGDTSSATLSTTENNALFTATDTVLYSAWIYVTSGQALTSPAQQLSLGSSGSRFVLIRHRPTGSPQGIHLSASSQTLQTLTGTPPMDQWIRLELEWNPASFIGRYYDDSDTLMAEATLVNNFLGAGQTVTSMAMSPYHGWVDGVTLGTPVAPEPVTAEAATRMFPRDDNRGLGSPRLYPPPKSGRVVGGYL